MIYKGSHYRKHKLPAIGYINEFILTAGQLPEKQRHGCLQSVSAAATVHCHGRPCSGKVTLFSLE
jgi:hypothetical protein